MAVFLCGQAQNMAGKMVGISFPISAFVAIGFDHIPADRFKNFLPYHAQQNLRGTSPSPPSRALAATGWFA
jgi:formate/nitrite transporter FocA (FNT family)